MQNNIFYCRKSNDKYNGLKRSQKDLKVYHLPEGWIRLADGDFYNEKQKRTKSRSPSGTRIELVQLNRNQNNGEKLSRFQTLLQEYQPFVGGEKAMNKLIEYIPAWHALNQRRRLAETPKPLGWKPSHDMDWSPDYRQ